MLKSQKKINRNLWSYCFSLALLCLSLSSCTTTKSTPVNKADPYGRIVEQFKAQHPVGLAVSIEQKGKLLWEDYSGYANLELDIPLTAQHRFRIGSLTKQFTAALVLKLMELDKLSLHDDIRQYAKDFHYSGSQITLHHLLTHTAGLDEFITPDILKLRIQEDISLDALITLIQEMPRIGQSGEQMRYSNSGYILLTKAIEVACAMSFSECLQQHLLKPYGLAATTYGGKQLIKNRAAGYTRTKMGIRNADDVNMSWPLGAGGLLSNVRDLQRWNHLLFSGQLLKDSSLRYLTHSHQLNNSQSTQYGFAHFLGQFGNFPIYAHNGSNLGFYSAHLYFPQQQLSLVATVNLDNNGGLGINIDRLLQDLAAQVLHIPKPEYAEVTVSEKELDRVTGSYQLPTGIKRHISIDNGQLMSQLGHGPKYRLIPMSAGRFYFKDSLTWVEFTTNAQGEEVMATYFNLNKTPQLAIKQKPSS
ncbi:serine hydrolase [Pleionea sp. CnH1-48]|uniref:serine hydrolase n=1 Tax=Pleionea sp. CnH1-48 TaxID=2954494 RepID=UPI0020983C74|nr:serine hydrolase [Pleionea sp. CnH1-48]MCO7224931.1 serine hydrolase [Pleionea sp. CnH1-48]